MEVKVKVDAKGSEVIVEHRGGLVNGCLSEFMQAWLLGSMDDIKNAGWVDGWMGNGNVNGWTEKWTVKNYRDCFEGCSS
jgi:hypothetical protein